MNLLAIIFGILLIVLVALDAFETIILPRRVTRRIRLATLFYRSIRFVWYSIARLFRTSARRDTFQGYMGPLSLLALLLFWARSSSWDLDCYCGDWRFRWLPPNRSAS